MTGSRSDLVEPIPTVGSHLIEALRIIDEQGKVEKESYLLQKSEWDALRGEIFQALWMVSD